MRYACCLFIATLLCVCVTSSKLAQQFERFVGSEQARAVILSASVASKQARAVILTVFVAARRLWAPFFGHRLLIQFLFVYVPKVI